MVFTNLVTASSCPFLTASSSERKHEVIFGYDKSHSVLVPLPAHCPRKPHITSCCFFDSCIFRFHRHIFKSIILPHTKWYFSRPWRSVTVAWRSLLPARVLRSVRCPQYTHTLLQWSAVLHGGAASPFPGKGISPLSRYLTIWCVSEWNGNMFISLINAIILKVKSD